MIRFSHRWLVFTSWERWMELCCAETICLEKNYLDIDDWTTKSKSTGFECTSTSTFVISARVMQIEESIPVKGVLEGFLVLLFFSAESRKKGRGRRKTISFSVSVRLGWSIVIIERRAFNGIYGIWRFKGHSFYLNLRRLIKVEGGEGGSSRCPRSN